jgi:pimeloyl-ACP methyl ester carboxylesterase
MNSGKNRAVCEILLTLALTACLALLMPGKGVCRPGDPTPVEFKSTDGVRLTGYLFGTGPTGVILTHMYPADQKSWFPLARKLAGKGYRVLTFNCRGYGESEGEKTVAEIDRDLEGAYRFLNPGVKQIFLVGASMGGTASIIMASRHPVAGIVSLSGPVAFKGLNAEKAVKKVKAPILFITSEGDVNAVMAARWMEHEGTSPARLLIFPGAEHGTWMLKPPRGIKVEEVIFQFLKDHGG